MPKITTRSIRWLHLTLIFGLMALAGLFGFLASITGSHAWLVPQVVAWVAALALLLLSGRPQ